MSSSLPVDRPAPPPGFVPPTLPSTATSSASLPTGYTRSHGIVLAPGVFTWLPVILLLMTLITTLFPWVGTHLESSLVDSQGPWRAMFGSVERNFRLEKVMHTPTTWLDNLQSNWETMMPALFALVLAVALALADRTITVFHIHTSQFLTRIWPWRLAIIATLAAIALAILTLQAWSGFGLEKAIRKVVAEQFKKQREEAAGSIDKLTTADYDAGQEYDKYNVGCTIWLYLGLLLNFLAVLALLCRIGLDRRGSKPPPRLVFQY